MVQTRWDGGTCVLIRSRGRADPSARMSRALHSLTPPASHSACCRLAGWHMLAPVGSGGIGTWAGDLAGAPCADTFLGGSRWVRWGTKARKSCRACTLDPGELLALDVTLWGPSLCLSARLPLLPPMAHPPSCRLPGVGRDQRCSVLRAHPCLPNPMGTRALSLSVCACVAGLARWVGLDI